MSTLQRVFIAAISSFVAIGSTLAIADPPRHRHWRGDIHHFHRYDYPRWRDGHWYHGDYRGRFGWWWIAADTWYYYPAPVYPYPDPYAPPVIAIEPAPAPPRESVWYYCESSRNYYPYVSACPEGWRTVPAQPRDRVDRDDYERDDE